MLILGVETSGPWKPYPKNQSFSVVYIDRLKFYPGYEEGYLSRIVDHGFFHDRVVYGDSATFL
jgi:hypothetical protein